MDRGLWAIVATVTIATSIPYITACPSECLCQLKDNVTTIIVCTEKSLRSLPDGIPANVQGLGLHGNRLSSLSDVFHNFTQVQSLDVSGNNLASLTDNDFSGNLELRNLSLADNSISSIPDLAFSQLEKLVVLNLSENYLEFINSAIFDGLYNLEHLDLSRNRLSNISEDSFSNKASMMSLNLSNNFIGYIPGNVFTNTNSIQILDISFNQINLIDGHMLEQLMNLEFLNVSHNEISDVINFNLPTLDVLDLSWNNLTNVTSDTFRHLGNLTTLILDGNPVAMIQSPVFAHLTRLETLSMSHMPYLTYLSKETFKGLDHLTMLQLHHNPHLSFIHKELFVSLPLLSIMDISENHIEALHNTTVQACPQLSALDIRGNMLTCDCELEWLLNELVSNDSMLLAKDSLSCVLPNSTVTVPLSGVKVDTLQCTDLTIVNFTADSAFKIGSSAILKCIVEGQPSPELTWITPRNRVLKYHNYHQYSLLDYLPLADQSAHDIYHALHDWHEQPSYYSESETREDRMIVLADGSLYIDYVMRPDGGPYRCIARNPHNETQVVIHVTLDYEIVYEVQIWTFIVGFACAGSFFLLNLIYSFTMAGIRRCVSKQRRKRIRQVIETVDQYKTARLARIKENYYVQVGKIRDQYHYQLGRLREHHQNQTGRLKGMRDGASHKVDKLKENYNNQLGRLKEYSSSQLVQIREKYNNQIDKIKDYGNYKLDRIHQKYKLKQQHVTKILEMMNLDNCRTTFETECVRTESMILGSDIFTTDAPINNALDSLSISDDEYLTATSSDHSRFTSRENVTSENKFEQLGYPVNPYVPDNNADDEDSEKEHNPKNTFDQSGAQAPNTQQEDSDLDKGEQCEGQSIVNDAYHIEPSTSKRSHRRKHHRKKHKHSCKGQMWRKSDPVLSTFSDEDDDFFKLLTQGARPRSLGDKMDVHKSRPQQQQPSVRGDNPEQVAVDIVPDCSGPITVTETNV